jgi:hypothetical protein
MFDPVNRLRRHVQQMIDNKTGTSPEDAIGVLRLSRLILEQDKSKAVYPTLWLYCNWALHPEIDKQDLGWELLEEINKGLRDDVDPINAVCRALRLSELRAEMSRLFAAKDIPPVVTYSLRNWRQFLGFMLDELTHRPIRFPANRTGKAAAIFDRLVPHAANGYVPIGLYLSNHSDCTDGTWDPPGFFFHVELIAPDGDRATIAGPLFFTEDATQFARP